MEGEESGGGLCFCPEQLGRQWNSLQGEELHSETVAVEVTVRHLEKEAVGCIGLEPRRESWAGDRDVEAMSRNQVIATSIGAEVDQEEHSGSHPELCI